MDTLIDFKEMSESDFPSYVDRTLEEHAGEKAKSFDLEMGKARKIAKIEMAALLPDGMKTKDNFFFSIEALDEEKLGQLWLRLTTNHDVKRVHLAEIFLFESSRGKGVGKKVMRFIDEFAERHSAKAIFLNVFGHNERARKLYESCGYKTSAITMSKRL